MSLHKRRTSIIVAVVVIGGILTVVGIRFATMPAGRHFRQYRDQTSLYRVLSGTPAGSIVSELEKELGPAKRLDDARRTRLIKAHRQMAERTPEAYSAGVMDGDQFIEYFAEPSGITLQIRDEHLVNFNPSNFRNPPKPINILNSRK